MIDPDERAEYLETAKRQYIGGEIQRIRLEAILVMCGYNATQITDFIREHHEAAFAAFQERARSKRPV